VAPVSQVGVPGGVQFQIMSGYNPLPPVDKATLEKAMAARDAQAQASKAHGPTSAPHKAASRPKVSAGTTTSKPAAKRGGK
jgi:hypothetical protein